VLIELGVMQQRHQAVLEVMGGLCVTEVARRYGVTRQTVHRWLLRYAHAGIAGLTDDSSRPASCPHQMPAAVEARIVELRCAHPGWGPRTIAHYLQREGLELLPGRSSIYRCLVRHRLVNPQRRRKRREDYRRWERLRSMELWQMNVMGGVRLEDGGELRLVSGLDDHSRYCVSVKLTPARPVCAALTAAMHLHGVPEQILTDNGKLFTARFGPGNGEVLFDGICRENGVRHLLTAPRSPTTTGQLERFHKTLRSEFLADRTFASFAEAQAELDEWVDHDNCERPHQGIGMVTTAKRFAVAACPPPSPRESRSCRSCSPRRAPRASRSLLRRPGVRSLGSWAAAARSASAASPTTRAPTSPARPSRSRSQRAARSRSATAACSSPLAPAAMRRGRTRPASCVPAADGRPAGAAQGRPTGTVSFAGTSYRAGNSYRGEQVEVRVVGDAVQLSHAGQIIRVHAARHDRNKEHGAFATPTGRPHRSDAAPLKHSRRNTGTGANA